MLSTMVETELDYLGFIESQNLWVNEQNLAVNRENLLENKKNLETNQKNLETNQKNLEVNKAKLLIGSESNSLLKQTNRELFDINSQLEILANIITHKAKNEEQENLSREVIFNIKKVDENLSKKSDKKFISLEAETLLECINSYGISTRSFTQIQDKEYFSNVITSLQEKVTSVSENERREANEFVALYFYVWNLIYELGKLENIKISHVPKDFAYKKNQSDEIFDISEEHSIALSIESFGFIPGARPISVRYEMLQTKLDSFCKRKLPYVIADLEGKLEDKVLKLQEKQKTYETFVAKITEGIKSIQSYLNNNPEFKESYPNFSIPILGTVQEIDFNDLKKETDTSIARAKENIYDFQQRYSDLLQKQVEKACTIEKTVREKQGTKKARIIVFSILSFAIIITIIAMWK